MLPVHEKAKIDNKTRRWEYLPSNNYNNYKSY